MKRKQVRSGVQKNHRGHRKLALLALTLMVSAVISLFFVIKRGIREKHSFSLITHVASVTNPNFTEVETLMRAEKSDPSRFGRAMASGLADLERFELVIPIRRKQVTGKQVDILLQQHFEDHFDAYQGYELDVEASQKRIEEILAFERYDVVACEGAAVNALTPEEWIKEMRQSQPIHPDAPEVMPFISVEEAREMIYRAANESGALRFGLDHPEQFIGAEVVSLNTCHWLAIRRVVQLSQGVGPTDPWSPQVSRYFALQKNLSRLRTFVAIGRLIEHLDRDGKSKGVLVIGLNHAVWLQEIADSFGVDFRVCNTTNLPVPVK